MVQINFAQKSVTVKIVYYGPGMSGKTTNLEVVHQRAPDNSRGELTSISTDGDRTLCFRRAAMMERQCVVQKKWCRRARGGFGRRQHGERALVHASRLASRMRGGCAGRFHEADSHAS